MTCLGRSTRNCRCFCLIFTFTPVVLIKTCVSGNDKSSLQLPIQPSICRKVPRYFLLVGSDKDLGLTLVVRSTLWDNSRWVHQCFRSYLCRSITCNFWTCVGKKRMGLYPRGSIIGARLAVATTRLIKKAELGKPDKSPMVPGAGGKCPVRPIKTDAVTVKPTLKKKKSDNQWNACGSQTLQCRGGGETVEMRLFEKVHQIV